MKFSTKDPPHVRRATTLSFGGGITLLKSILNDLVSFRVVRLIRAKWLGLLGKNVCASLDCGGLGIGSLNASSVGTQLPLQNIIMSIAWFSWRL
ncbi:hypothetical protein Tco_1153899 [Tanacetum coccineum]